MRVMNRLGAVERFHDAMEECAVQAMSGSTGYDAVQTKYLYPDPEIDSESPWTGQVLFPAAC